MSFGSRLGLSSIMLYKLRVDTLSCSTGLCRSTISLTWHQEESVSLNLVFSEFNGQQPCSMFGFKLKKADTGETHDVCRANVIFSVVLRQHEEATIEVWHAKGSLDISAFAFLWVGSPDEAGEIPAETPGTVNGTVLTELV